MAGLFRLTVALGLEWPFAESGVNGWASKLKDHIVQPKILFEAAQLAHFDYLANMTANPFLLATCASVWFACLGMCGDAHIQRSYLLKRCKAAWIFHCVQGKDNSKPYDWVIPRRTMSGDTVSLKLMSVVRLRKSPDEQPYLPVGTLHRRSSEWPVLESSASIPHADEEGAHQGHGTPSDDFEDRT